MIPEQEELRVKAIKAMASKLLFLCDWDGFDEEEAFELATDIFDAQHGIVRVVPEVATLEMIRAAYGPQYSPGYAQSAFEAMAAAGDLTKAPK